MTDPLNLDAAGQLGWLASDGLPQLALLVDSRVPGATGSGARSVEPRPPLHLHVVALQLEVHSILVGWVRICLEDGLAEGWPADSTISVCQWLQGHAATLLRHDAAGEFVDEVRQCTRRVWRALGERPERRPSCPECGNLLRGHGEDGETVVQETPGSLRALPLADWRWADCPDCGRDWLFDDGLLQLGKHEPETAQEWADDMGIGYEALKKRLQRSCVQPDGYDHRGRRTYRRETITRMLVKELAS